MLPKLSTNIFVFCVMVILLSRSYIHYTDRKSVQKEPLYYYSAYHHWYIFSQESTVTISLVILSLFPACSKRYTRPPLAVPSSGNKKRFAASNVWKFKKQSPSECRSFSLLHKRHLSADECCLWLVPYLLPIKWKDVLLIYDKQGNPAFSYRTGFYYHTVLLFMINSFNCTAASIKLLLLLRSFYCFNSVSPVSLFLWSLYCFLKASTADGCLYCQRSLNCFYLLKNKGKQRKQRKTNMKNKHEKRIKRIRIIAAVWYISCFWLFMQCFYCFYLLKNKGKQTWKTNQKNTNYCCCMIY